MDVFEMTTMILLGGGHAPVVAALNAVGPNSVGDPMIGLFGWLPFEERFALARAADLAHRHTESPGWPVYDDPADLADLMFEAGGWRNESEAGRVELARLSWSIAHGWPS